MLSCDLCDLVSSNCTPFTAEKIKFSIKDFSSKCDEIRRKLRIWSHLLEEPLMENFMFYAVIVFVLHSVQPPLCWGVEPPINFWKRGSLRGSQSLERDCSEKRVDLFQGGLQFY